jgi:hypothetical protein
MGFSNVSIVGAGPAGCGIAIACAAEGLPVTLVRSSRGDLGAVRARLERRLAVCVDLGELESDARDAILTRIAITSSQSAVADAEIVIDATRCDNRARRAMLATLESRMSSGAVLATCASADRLAEIAEVLRRADQLVGMRFALPATGFAGRGPAAPASLDLRVELAFLPETAPGVIGACRGLAARLRKTPTEHPSTPPPPVRYREWLSEPPPPAAAE